MAGYSDKELKAHKKYLEKHPHCDIWTTETGQQIPFVMLNDDHLTNIIHHLKNRKKQFEELGAKHGVIRTQEVITELEILKKKRLLKSTVAGKILYE